MKIDVCYGGCGGIWFDAHELERVKARAEATGYTIGEIPVGKVNPTGMRLCPRCDRQLLRRKGFSEVKEVEIDECPQCSGIWLDAGEFHRIYEESKRVKETSPLWLAALDLIAAKELKPPKPANRHSV